ncbi:AAA family ATPase [uncultured Faecalicoccus sp.]|uniref:ATP-binding protein n=1 Tax=uncultured Faecalicoccus sp. TaxID=1971760 RepID=UPI0025CD9D65|nr:AAA family ATPase [uncultured Faecalicoccus sp.]
MLYRKIECELKSWLDSSKKAILIDGARQVGKSTIVLQFLKAQNQEFVCFDLIKDKNVLDAFNTSSSADQLLLRLSALSSKPLNPGKTIIFIDEAQEAEDAITPIKYLVKDQRYRYVVSGSLLGIKMKNVQSIPIGYMSVVQMYPLDFEEFALANGVNPSIISYLETCFETKETVDAQIHKQMLELFNLYLIIGGMPEAVQEFVNSHNIARVQSILADIDQNYQMDISKYDKEEKLLIEDIYKLIPSELNAQNKRFILKELNQNARFYQYDSSFVWLINSGVGLFTYNVDNPVYPLLASKERTLFKLFLCDVGLLCSKLYGETVIKILNGETNVNFGAIYESVVAQELTAHDFPLFYHNNKKRGEVDFLIEQEDQVVPIEVKSGKDYKRHSALTNMLQDPSLQIEKAYILNYGNIQVQDRKIYLPVYMVMFIKKTKEREDTIYVPDLSKLR